MISVIVPVYKVEPYLRECIDSILAQTYADFELILVDDGSPDRCGEICDEYAAKDSRIRMVHQKNAGVSAARNAGLDIAQGEYIAFVDSDDMIVPNYLETLLEIVHRTGADISTTRYFKHDKRIEINIQEDEYVFSGKDACLQLYLSEEYFSRAVWGKLYIRKIWDNIRFPKGRIHEDQAVLPLVLYRATKVVSSCKELYYYRVVETSIMHKAFSVERYDDIVAIDSCIGFFKDKNETEIVKRANSQRKILLAAYSICARETKIYSQLPKAYQMSELRALFILNNTMPDDKYSYYLAKIHPNWLRPHEYLRKIKKILHIPCK